MRTARCLVLVAGLVLVSGLISHAGDTPPGGPGGTSTVQLPPPHRREWPVTETHRAALDLLDAQGSELARAHKQLEEADAKLRARFEAVIAEIRSSCYGLAPGEKLELSPKRDLFFVSDTAPVTSR